MPANNLMLMTARARAAASTYLMARRSLLAPYLMSSVAGTWAHVSSASYLLGGALQSSTHADDDEIAALANHPIAQGTHDYRLLHNTFTTKPIFALDVNGAEEASVDQYGGSVANVVSEDSFTLGTKSAALSLRTSGKNASSTDYYASAQLGEVVKTSDGNDWGSGPEDLPWYQDIPPWFTSEGDGPETWFGDTNQAFGGTIRLTDANEEYSGFRLFCPATASYQIVVQFMKLPTGPKVEFTVDDGSVLHTEDTWNSGSNLYNQNVTVPLGTLSAGWHTLKLTANGRNVGNTTGFNTHVSWLQLQRTSTGTCPAGINGPEQVLLLPIFSDSQSGTWILSVSGNQVLYGWQYSITASASKSWDVNLRAGTYRARINCLRWVDGATNINLDVGASTEGSFNTNGSNTYNHIVTLTGISIPSDGKHTIKLEKTAGSYFYLSSLILERTGD